MIQSINQSIKNMSYEFGDPHMRKMEEQEKKVFEEQTLELQQTYTLDICGTDL